MEGDSRRMWFKTKTYGWGWVPCTPEGWAVVGVGVAVFAAFIALAMVFAESPAWFLLFTALAFVAIGVMVYVSWRTGEKPRWRWGRGS
jgi:hypothetical protein